jgi:hypothetical protein
LNFYLPQGFRLEPNTAKDTRPRRTEADNLAIETPHHAFGKRVISKRKTPTFEEVETKKPQGTAFNKALNLLRLLKKQPEAAAFVEPVNLTANPEYLTHV